MRVHSSNLTYQYAESKLLTFPDISLVKGQVLLISGHSGCGKTTLLHLLAGLRKSASGKIEIDNNSITDFSSAKMDAFRGKNIGIFYQQTYFIQAMSLLDNLMLSPYSNDKEKLKTLADRLQISELMSRMPSCLSEGQKQRASIVRAMMNEPKLLLADEPTSALDNANCERVINLLLDEAKMNHTALIITTHDDRLKSHITYQMELNSLDSE